jgi:hypothetical protein
LQINGEHVITMQISSISTTFRGPVAYILWLSSKSYTFRVLLRPGTSNGFAPLYAIVHRAGRVGNYATVFRIASSQRGKDLAVEDVVVPRRDLKNEVGYLRKGQR